MLKMNINRVGWVRQALNIYKEPRENKPRASFMEKKLGLSKYVGLFYALKGTPVKAV